MTKIENVFMLSIDARLDYETLRKVSVTGHSRIPVYEEIELPAPDGQSAKLKKIVGVLLVKQVCFVFVPSMRVSITHGFPSVFSSIPVMQFLCAVSRYTEYRLSRRMSPSLVFLINFRKVVRTWPLSRVHR
jgi:metal transporter CNNM